MRVWNVRLAGAMATSLLALATLACGDGPSPSSATRGSAVQPTTAGGSGAIPQPPIGGRPVATGIGGAGGATLPVAGAAGSNMNASSSPTTTTPGAAAQAGSGGASAPAALPPCDDKPGPAVVTDIHGTLSVEDWLDNLGNQTARPGSVQMLQEYAKRGYSILYVSGAPRSIVPETVRWFKEKGYPTERAVLTMPETSSLVSSVNRRLKTMRLEEFAAKGYRVQYGYGDKDSDVQAYEAAGLTPDHIFTIGDDAGLLGTVALDKGKPAAQAGYEEHVRQFVATVPAVCAPSPTGADIMIVE